MDLLDQPKVNGGTDFFSKQKDLIQGLSVQISLKNMSEAFIVHLSDCELYCLADCYLYRKIICPNLFVFLKEVVKF